MRCTASGLAIASLVLTGAITAHAADLPPVLKAPPAVFSWAGLYGGLNLGVAYDVGRINPTLAFDPFAVSDPTGAVTGVPVAILIIPGTFHQRIPTSRDSKLGILGGAQLGYNWQMARWIYGVEADAEGTNASESFTGAFTSNLLGVNPGGNIGRSISGVWTADRQWQASLRGRLGYTFDRLMVYGTGGIAFTGVNMTATYTTTTTLGAALTPFPVPGFPIPNGTSSVSQYHTLVGGTIGAGFDYAITNAITVGGEYRYTHYSEKNFNLANQAVIPPGPVTLNLDTHQFMARVNYFFGR